MKDWMKVFKVAPSAVFIATNEASQDGGRLCVRIEARVLGAQASTYKSFATAAEAGQFFDLVDQAFVEKWWCDLNARVVEEFEGYFMRGLPATATARGLLHA